MVPALQAFPTVMAGLIAFGAPTADICAQTNTIYPPSIYVRDDDCWLVSDEWVTEAPFPWIGPSEIYGESFADLSGAESVKHSQLNDQLDLFMGLNNGWDGEGSFAPSAEELINLRMVLAGMPAGSPIPKAALASSGQLSLYWDERSYYIDMEFDGNEALTIYGTSKVVSSGRRYEEASSVSSGVATLLQMIASMDA